MKTKDNLPEILKYNDKIKDSPVCHAALSLKKDCFPIRWGKFERKYLNVNALWNSEKTGYRQVIKPYEDVIFKKAKHLIAEFDKKGVSKSKVEDYYSWVNSYIKEMYKKEFDINLN